MKRFGVFGATCAACVAQIEKAVAAVPGVESVVVGLLTNSMNVEGAASPNAIVAAVEKAGYRATFFDENSSSTRSGCESNDANWRDRETSQLKRRLFVSLFFLILTFYFSTGVSAFGWATPRILANPGALGLAQLLTSGAILILNRNFFVGGFTSLRRGAPNMDALIAIGSGAAFLYSVAVLFGTLDAAFSGDATRATALARDFYFESAAAILVFVSIGKTLEAQAKKRTTSALNALAKLTPRTATIIRDGVEENVNIERVRKGDVFVVRPGESVPVDGVVLTGESAIDESALTGESAPVDKASGDAVSAGTLNASGFLRCEAIRVGDETTLAQIVRLTADAAASKAPIARTADRVASVFVPTTLAIAATTIFVWVAVGQSVGFALARGISVLVISCPCALGLATPAAITVGIGVGARRGILFKTAEALENAGKTAIVAFDKTGVLTEGRPTTTDVLPVEGVSEDELLTVAVSLEVKSEHPLGRAVVEYAAEKNVAPNDVECFKSFVGNGLSASNGGVSWVGGKRDFVALFADVPKSLVAAADAFANDGKTPLYFAKEGQVLGVVAVEDALRNDAAKMVARLKKWGLRVVALTGDVRRVAEAVGRRVGLDETFAELLPDGKERAIRELAASGRVAMIGDGINDAPALTRADVGIAVGSGTDVALAAADVVLVKNRLSDALAAIRLSRATLRNVRENLFWAFVYNVVGIPLAAGVGYSTFGWKLSPAFAALAMSLSSVCVVSNALRLNFFNPDFEKKNRKLQTNEREKMTINRKTMKIEGMMCEHCEARVKKTLETLESVETAAVDFQKGVAILTLRAPIDDDALKNAVVEQGYVVREIE